MDIQRRRIGQIQNQKSDCLFSVFCPLSSVLCLLSIIILAYSQAICSQQSTKFPTIGKIARYESRVNDLVPFDAKIELLASGFEWSECPLWIQDPNGGYLLFSDIPRNSVMKWREGAGISLFMKPSGYTGIVDYGREPGSNGLALDVGLRCY